MKQFRNLLRMSIAQIADGGLGAVTVGLPLRGYVGFEAADDGVEFDLTLAEGAQREVFEAVYTHASRSLSRGAVLRSTAIGNARVHFSRRASVQVVISAETMNALLEQMGGGLPAAPHILTQPQAASVLVGAQASFSVSVSGQGVTYQWLRGGQPIDGATSSTYTFTASAGDDGAVFTVVATNAGGFVQSSPAALTVGQPVVAPEITTQPVDRSVTEGQSVTFSVVAMGSSLTYRWFRNGVFVTGATSASWTFAAALAHDGAEIYVEVKNSADAVTSDVVTLDVAAAVDSRPFFFLGPADAHLVNTQAYIAGGTVAGKVVPPAKRFGSNNSKVGQDTFVTSGGLYGWMAIPRAAAAALPGVIFRLVNQGNTIDAWNGAGLPGIQPNPSNLPINSGLYITVAGLEYEVFRLGWPDSLPNAGEVVSIS